MESLMPDLESGLIQRLGRRRRRLRRLRSARLMSVVAASAGVVVAAVQPPTSGAASPGRNRQPVSRTHSVVRDVLFANGIGVLRFGAPVAAARAEIDTLLGQAGGAYRRGGSCRVDHWIKWLDQWTANGQPSLILYFSHSRFAGYEFGDPGGPAVLRNPPGGWRLATARGLGVGDTLARGRRLYGRAFAVSAAQGGSWRVRVRGGVITGYASGVPGPGQRVEVATIDAGEVGCPAVSP